MGLSRLRIGYVPLSRGLISPGDRRRFCYYAGKRHIAFEIADPSKAYDVVVVTQKGDLSVWSRYALGKARVIYDFIDSYWAIPRHDIKGMFRGLAKFVAGQSRYLQLDHWKAIEGMCRRADAVICSTEEQRRDISGFCGNTHIVLDIHSNVVRQVKHDYVSGEVFNLVWEGLPCNIGSLGQIAEVLRELKRRKKLVLHIVTDLEYYKYMGKFGHQHTSGLVKRLFDDVQLHAWDEKTCASIVVGCDLAIIPIPLDDPLAAGKPENKLVLFWKMGMPVIVSATPAYGRAMRACGLPMMACQTKEEWCQALAGYMENEAARREAGKAGRSFAENHYSEERILASWDEVFRSIL